VDLTVGFDLDMTLVDTRAGLHAVMTRLSRELGVPIDADLMVGRLGPPIEVELAHWLPADQIAAAATRFRELMAEFGAAQCVALPGARAAVEAVRASGGAVVVVTAKKEALATVTLAAAGLEVDAVVGSLHGAGKAAALRAHGATVYVGDHPLDVLGARAADAFCVGVRTGGEWPVDADVLLDDLTFFPAWYDGHLLNGGLDGPLAAAR
jgi:phosphoglycolate phosphatase